MPLRDLLRRRARLWPRCRELFGGLRALEVGGPSRLFTPKGRLPVYPVLASVDLLDFGGETLWGGAAKSPPSLPPGERLLGEAARLGGKGHRRYGLVLASHVLEHLANPLRALEGVRRVLEGPGWLLLVLPHHAGTFDHRRPVTTLAHLVADREHDVGEDDDTHLDEILRLHDLARDPAAGGREAFEERARDNLRHRALHHHVFDPSLAVRMLDRVGYGVEAVEVIRPYHLILLARADGQGRRTNVRHLLAGARWRERSPFPVDRRGP